MSSSAVPPAVPGGSRSPVRVNVHTYPAQLQYPPRTYLVFSVLVTIFCFPPTGLVALVNALRVHSLWKAQEHDKSRKASRRARNWGLLSLAIGIVMVVFVVFWSSINYLNG
ncbi:CD225/dispanin family protein [Promicromonospora iranensis]|uniref:Membrane protein n=1 Tax=Promicromonospora iranensis TaxID=1105144 RepID=A0ABU2CNK6_9MICO|nr:CD225/dispanin family protein [Promicromonospora iranensis]MDR7382919.1 putative membrane protein [Promicromonospora iranensis]